MELPDLEPHAYQSLLKLGGKKKLDTLLDLLKANGHERVKELQHTADLSEAKAAARPLKSSAANLGLAALEDVCDQILAAKTWSLKHPLSLEAEAKLRKGLALLIQARAGL
jgi:hypothetical protein